MLKLSDMIAKRAEAFDKLTALQESISKENRAYKPEELTKFGEIEAEVRSWDETIAAKKKEEELALRAAAYEPNNAGNGNGNGGGSGIPATVDKKEPVFRSFGEQLQAIAMIEMPHINESKRTELRNKLEEVEKRAALEIPGLQKRSATGSNTQVDSDGGFLIAPSFAAEIQQRTFDVGQLAAKCKPIPMPQNANRLVLRARQDDNRANGQRLGGIQASWVNEADTATPSKPKFRLITFDVKKLLAFYYATDEELADAPLIEAIALDGFSDELSFVLDDAIIRGDGAEKPLGILNSNAAVVVAKDSGQAAGTVTYTNILNMEKAFAGKDGAYFAHKNTLVQLAQMVLPTGQYSGAAVYLPANGAAGVGYQTLMGRPLYFVEQMEDVGTNGDIMLADMSQYGLCQKGGMRTDSSIHVRYLYGEQVFRIQWRLNGQPLWDKPVTPYKGSQKVSPFVTLATRS